MTKTSYLLLDWRVIDKHPNGEETISGPHVTGIYDSVTAAFAAGSKHARVIEVCEVVRPEEKS